MGENNGCMNYQVYSALFAKTLRQRATTLVIMAAHTSKTDTRVCLPSFNCQISLLSVSH